MILDLEKYLPHLDDCYLTDAQKEEYIRTVWDFLDAFLEQDLRKKAQERGAALLQVQEK